MLVGTGCLRERHLTVWVRGEGEAKVSRALWSMGGLEKNIG